MLFKIPNFRLRHSLKTGLSFGLTSGVITTLGLMNRHTTREIWESTISTFLSKFIFALTFILPILLFSLPIAIIISVIWGLTLLSIFSFYMAKEQRKSIGKVIIEHIGIALIVIIIAHYVGDWIASTFG